jgi:HPt (histidine-containing phosphotransfer) domain-containing protein
MANFNGTAVAALLDPGAIQRLRELDPGDKAGLVGRVLATYATSLERMLDQLARARATADAATVRQIAHTLKSSSASVGALELSAACARVEAMLQAGGPPEPAHVDAMADEGSRVLAGLRGAAASQSPGR